MIGLGAVWDSWSSSEALQVLSEVGAPEAHTDVGVRRGLEGLRARGVSPMVRVVFWHGTHFFDSWGSDLERWGRLAYGLDPMPGGTPATAPAPRAAEAREAVRGGKDGLSTASPAGSRRRDRSPTRGARWRELASSAEPAVPLRSSGPGVIGRRVGQLVAAGEWDVADYLRIRSAETMRVPPDTAVLVDRLDLEPGVRDVVSAGAGGLVGLGLLPVMVGHQRSMSLHARMCRFDPEPVMVVVLRAQLRRCPLPKGLVVAVGRVRHRPTASAEVGVVEAVADDPEVVALRGRLLHCVLVEPPHHTGSERFTLWPEGKSGPESRDAG